MNVAERGHRRHMRGCTLAKHATTDVPGSSLLSRRFVACPAAGRMSLPDRSPGTTR